MTPGLLTDRAAMAEALYLLHCEHQSDGTQKMEVLELHAALLHWAQQKDAALVELAFEFGWLDWLSEHHLHTLKLEALQCHPQAQDVDIQLQRAATLRQVQREDEAQSLLLQVLEALPDHVEARRLLGLLHSDHGRHREALRYLKDAWKLSPQHPQLPGDLDQAFKRADRHHQIQLQFQTGTGAAERKLCQEFWTPALIGRWRHRQTDLARELGLLPPALREWVACRCIATSNLLTCDRCMAPVVFETREAYEKRRQLLQEPCHCPDCQHEVLLEAKQAAEVYRNRQLQVLKDTFDPARLPEVSVEQLSLRQAVYLLTVMEAAGSKGSHHLVPLQATQWMTPSEDFSQDLLMELQKADLIAVHPQSRVEAFVWEGERVSKIIVPYVHWWIPTGQRQGFSRLQVKLQEALQLPLPERWQGELSQLVEDVLHLEALLYLLLCLKKVQVRFEPAPQTEGVLRSLIHQHSLGEVWGIIDWGMKEIQKFIRQEKPHPVHAANRLVTLLKNRSQQATEKGWKLLSYNRTSQFSESTLSRVVFEHLLGIPEFTRQKVFPLH